MVSWNTECLHLYWQLDCLWTHWVKNKQNVSCVFKLKASVYIWMHLKCQAYFHVTTDVHFIPFIPKSLTDTVWHFWTYQYVCHSKKFFCSSVLPQSLLLFGTLIKTACMHKHIAALNNAIHHVEQHVHCSFSNTTIMQLIIVFNGDCNHFFHYCTLLLLLAVKRQKTKFKAEWKIDTCNDLFTFNSSRMGLLLMWLWSFI